MLSRAIRIVEYVNMGITVLFFFFYVFRLVSLRHFAVTDRYRSTNSPIQTNTRKSESSSAPYTSS